MRRKILNVVTTLQYGGIENVAMNFIRYADKNKFQVDYLVCNSEIGEYEQEVADLGGRVIRLKSSCMNIFLFSKELKELLIREQYDVVHSHILFRSGIILRVSKEAGVKRRIAHSHTTKIGMRTSIVKKLYQLVMRRWLNKYATDKIACGLDAGFFLFGKKFLDSGLIINNGVDSSKFVFNQVERNKIRKELKIENKKVIINVARLLPVKNHKFMIEIMDHLKDSNYILLFVGDGYLMNDLKMDVKNRHLEHNILFLGSRGDVNNLLQAADLFIMASFFEGLPLSVIEAQAAGLRCLLSTNITPEVDISGLVEFLDLDINIDLWTNYIKNNCEYERKDMSAMIKEKGYDLNTNYKLINNLYAEL